MGEGFGVPIIEAQAAGCPVIVGDWTAMSELCFSGIKVAEEDADPFYLPLNTFQFAPRIRAIEIALEAEYKHPSSRERARREALASDADTVTRAVLEARAGRTLRGTWRLWKGAK